MKKGVISGKVIISCYLLILAISACQSYENQDHKYPSTIGTFADTGDFTINPTTILASLNRGEMSVFTPTLATPSADKLFMPGSIQWTQSDYLKVANALSQVVWKDSLEGWFIYHLAFKNECQDNLSGFDSVDIIYYKTIEVSRQKMYTARYIKIYPLAGVIYWGGGTNFPISEGWGAIDLKEFKITADDALRIAEENGGMKARSSVHNDCSISISLPNHNNDDSWDIAYYYRVNFEIIVDPYSGEYEVPTPSP